jgi:hypothetical protein
MSEDLVVPADLDLHTGVNFLAIIDKAQRLESTGMVACIIGMVAWRAVVCGTTCANVESTSDFVRI